MTRQTTRPLQATQFDATNRSARELARLVEDGTLTIDAPYQRGDAWSTDQQIALVQSWLRGLPIPAIIVNNRMTERWRTANPDHDLAVCYAAVDGRQRLTAAVAWFSGALAVPASWFEPEDVEATEDTEDGPYVRYTGLSGARQRHSAFTWLMPMAESSVATVREEAEIFMLVNGAGTPQSDDDMARAARVAEGE